MLGRIIPRRHNDRGRLGVLLPGVGEHRFHRYAKGTGTIRCRRCSETSYDAIELSRVERKREPARTSQHSAWFFAFNTQTGLMSA